MRFNHVAFSFNLLVVSKKAFLFDNDDSFEQHVLKEITFFWTTKKNHSKFLSKNSI